MTKRVGWAESAKPTSERANGKWQRLLDWPSNGGLRRLSPPYLLTLGCEDCWKRPPDKPNRRTFGEVKHTKEPAATSRRGGQGHGQALHHRDERVGLDVLLPLFATRI